MYLGTLLRGASMDGFIHWLADLAGVEPILRGLPEGVRAYERQGSLGDHAFRLVFLCNFSGNEQSIELGDEWEDLLTEKTSTKYKLEEAGVVVLRKYID